MGEGIERLKDPEDREFSVRLFPKNIKESIPMNSYPYDWWKMHWAETTLVDRQLWKGIAQEASAPNKELQATKKRWEQGK